MVYFDQKFPMTFNGKKCIEEKHGHLKVWEMTILNNHFVLWARNWYLGWKMIAIWREVRSCIYFVFGGYITQHCEHIYFFLYENEYFFCGRVPFYVMLKLLPYKLYFILGSDWCQKYCLYQDICTEWRLLGNKQRPDGLCWWCTGTIDIRHSFLPWTGRGSGFWIYICKTFNHLSSSF